jgi:amidohydrolase
MSFFLISLRKVLVMTLSLTTLHLYSAELASNALPAKLIKRVNSSVNAAESHLVKMYKDLHQHPEIAFTEVRTSGIVARELQSLGFKVTKGIGVTGVVGVLTNGPGPVVWYRADMDALSIKETTGLPYAATAKQRLGDGSEINVMHACGHDAHTTWLLGMAKTMVELKDAWSGTLVVYAQPAEEIGAGAQAMIKDGLWKRNFPKPDYAFAVHTAPGPVGMVASGPGVRLAGGSKLDVTFTGVGGHGSTPQLTLDPVVMAAQAVLSYQTIISRNLDPQSAAVLTVGSIEAGKDSNVIPSSALLKLNLRWFTPTIRELMIKRINEINRGIAIAAGVPNDKLPTLVLKGHSEPVVNDAKLTASLNYSIKSLLGEKNVIDNFPAVMGSEDFHKLYKGMDVPYTFLLIGVAPPKLYAEARAAGRQFPYSNHSPNFFVDLAAIPIGAKVNSVVALSVLAKRA